MADVRYRADSELAAAQAVLALLQLARSGKDDFTFGPTDWDTIVQQGLLVENGNDATAAALAAVPGLVEVTA